jgi:16S rRNA (guanine527-N7)-methyltransferase
MFWEYLDLLESWNRAHRLVGSSDRRWMVEKVVLDSLLFLPVIPPEARSLLDIGSGAGLPGIPIKIVKSELELVMVESRRWRSNFLGAVIRGLGLRGSSVIHGLAQTLLGDRKRFDVVAARCAGPAEEILTLGSGLVSQGGVVVVSGSSRSTPGPGTEVIRVLNPITREPRYLLVRR